MQELCREDKPNASVFLCAFVSLRRNLFAVQAGSQHDRESTIPLAAALGGGVLDAVFVT